MKTTNIIVNHFRINIIRLQGLQSLALAAGEEFMGSFAGIAATLISFNKNTELPAYIRIAEALEGTEGEGVGECECANVKGVKEAFEKKEWLREPLH